MTRIYTRACIRRDQTASCQPDISFRARSTQQATKKHATNVHVTKDHGTELSLSFFNKLASAFFAFFKLVYLQRVARDKHIKLSWLSINNEVDISLKLCFQEPFLRRRSKGCRCHWWLGRMFENQDGKLFSVCGNDWRHRQWDERWNSVIKGFVMISFPLLFIPHLH